MDSEVAAVGFDIVRTRYDRRAGAAEQVQPEPHDAGEVRRVIVRAEIDLKQPSAGFPPRGDIAEIGRAGRGLCQEVRDQQAGRRTMWLNGDGGYIVRMEVAAICKPFRLRMSVRDGQPRRGGINQGKAPAWKAR